MERGSGWSSLWTFRWGIHDYECGGLVRQLSLRKTNRCYVLRVHVRSSLSPLQIATNSMFTNKPIAKCDVPIHQFFFEVKVIRLICITPGGWRLCVTVGAPV